MFKVVVGDIRFGYVILTPAGTYIQCCTMYTFHDNYWVHLAFIAGA